MHKNNEDGREALAAEVYFALRDEHTGEARPRWIRLIRAQISACLLASYGSQLVEEIFDELAARYVSLVLRGLGGNVWEDLPVMAWLTSRVQLDAYNVAKALVKDGELLLDGDTEEEGHSNVQIPALVSVLDEVFASDVMKRVRQLADTLPLKERRAVQARLASDMDVDHTYAKLDLPPGSRARANHNQAFKTGLGKIRAALASEEYLA